ncbi:MULTISPECIES: Pycsar system effector family protein [unclassified Streptomyces]|uniref:Pycsar system effector family protein n=1 Tax=unclassified Streptomyces TaxID=2593676 RepID=UPI00381288B9
MTTTEPLPVAVPQAHVDTAVATLRAELGRSDSKASLLLALTGATLAGLVSAAGNTHLPTASLVTGSFGAVAMLTATVLLLLSVRPTLSGTGWPRWPAMPDEQLRAQLAAGQQIDEAKVLAAAAARKFRRIRAAIDCALVGLGFLALAAALAAVL